MDTIQYLNQRINTLEIKLDSIQRMENIQELNVKLEEQANIISSVGDFYESAWLKLIIVISILGIVIPIIIQYFQKDTLKQVTSFLSKEIKETFDLRIRELEKSNQSQIDILSKNQIAEMDNIKSNYQCISNELEASLFYLQGKQSHSRKSYASALKDYKKSAEFWLSSSKPERIRVILKNIDLCIKALKTKTAFKNALSDHDIEWNSFISQFKNNESFNDILKQIKSTISKLE